MSEERNAPDTGTRSDSNVNVRGQAICDLERKTMDESQTDGETQDMNRLLHITGLRAESGPSDMTTKTTNQRAGHKWKISALVGVLVLISCAIAYSVHSARQIRTVNAIRDALVVDVALARQLAGNQTLYACDAKTLQAYAQGLRKIDMSRCPREFEIAYLEHIQAWESLARSRESVDAGPILSLLQGNLLGLLSELSDDTEGPMKDEIVATWNEVERIALSYGVKVPE